MTRAVSFAFLPAFHVDLSYAYSDAKNRHLHSGIQSTDTRCYEDEYNGAAVECSQYNPSAKPGEIVEAASELSDAKTLLINIALSIRMSLLNAVGTVRCGTNVQTMPSF